MEEWRNRAKCWSTSMLDIRACVGVGGFRRPKCEVIRRPCVPHSRIFVAAYLARSVALGSSATEMLLEPFRGQAGGFLECARLFK